MMACDALEAVGLNGQYIVKINSRKTLDGILEATKVSPTLRGTVMRAIDKLDRLGSEGVRLLLGEGRKDESGDFTKGAGLSKNQVDGILSFITSPDDGSKAIYGTSEAYGKGVAEVLAIRDIVESAGYGNERIQVDKTIIRGLDYYTGPVFEAQLTFPVTNEAGETIQFGSVVGGGRYDDLVARFTGQQVPATGISIGVSRRLSAWTGRGLNMAARAPLIVVTVFDKAESAAAFQMVAELRAAGLRAESYVGNGKMGDQFKYADKRGAAIAIVEGPDERAKG